MSVLNQKHFHDEKAAYAFVEAHVWPDGRVCPHCGVLGESGPLKGQSTRIGVYKCYACRKPFTVKVGTVFEASHIKLHVWLQAIFLLSSSKKGMSANQLHRILGITLKSAWFLSHRIREAMRDGGLEPIPESGGVGTVPDS
jgi:transposase-like protein